ncbi:MAG: L-histidine N(alpha)-methyltransferase [Pseudomonadota bacterium]
MDLPSPVDAQRLAFAHSVLDGLAQTPKTLQPRWFYDATGARLFEAITEVDHYYLTRTELGLLRTSAQDVAAALGDNVAIVEPGSGEGQKVRPLLDAMGPAVSRYVPIDIAADQLQRLTAELTGLYPDLTVSPVAADFFKPFDMPDVGNAVVFFPGSTIGNMAPDDAVAFLQSMRTATGADRFLIGFDLVKDETVLVDAYDDPVGVTAAFNKNILQRINRELGGTFNLRRFDHEAIFNADAARIEMHLVARGAQEVKVAGRTIAFADGETIHTENSHKYTRETFAALAAKAGLTEAKTWSDRRNYFALMLLEATS